MDEYRELVESYQVAYDRFLNSGVRETRDFVAGKGLGFKVMAFFADPFDHAFLEYHAARDVLRFLRRRRKRLERALN